MIRDFLRIILFFGMLVAVLALPWWLTAIFLFVLAWYFEFYLEIVFFGFLVDLLYFPKSSYFYPAMTLSLLCLLLILFIKPRIRT